MYIKIIFQRGLYKNYIIVCNTLHAASTNPLLSLSHTYAHARAHTISLINILLYSFNGYVFFYKLTFNYNLGGIFKQFKYNCKKLRIRICV